MNWIVTELIILFYICGIVIGIGIQISISNGYALSKTPVITGCIICLTSWVGVGINIIIYGTRKEGLWFSNKMINAPYLQYRFVDRDKNGEVIHQGVY